MPKPNKYNGDGSLKPGRNVGPEPHLSAAAKHGEYIPVKRKGTSMNIVKRLALYILLAAVCAVLLGGLSGCQVNVVNVVNSDLGFDASTAFQQLAE
ncbi:hypothetical protein Vasula_00003 [Pseudomonas phage vB_PpuP-Vasula]